jgi:hypothetical protein
VGPGFSLADLPSHGPAEGVPGGKETAPSALLDEISFAPSSSSMCFPSSPAGGDQGRYFPITAKIAEKDTRTLGLDGLTHLIFGRVTPGAT